MIEENKRIPRLKERATELYKHAQYESAIQIATELTNLLGKSASGDNIEYAKSVSFLANLYALVGDFQKAKNCYLLVLRILSKQAEATDNETRIVLIGLAYVYNSLGNSKKAIEISHRALEINKRIGDKQGESATYANLGTAYQALGDYARAIEYYHKALQISTLIKDKAGMAAAFSNLGRTYQALGDYDKAIEYNKEALQFAKELRNRYLESTCYANLGAANYELGRYQESIEYQELSLQIKLRIGDKQGESIAYANLGAAYQALGDYTKAIEILEKALIINEQIKNESGRAPAYANLGAAYQALGDHRKAIEYYHKALDIARKMGDQTSEQIINLNMGAAYLQSNNPATAYDYFKTSVEISEKIAGNLFYLQSKHQFRNMTYDAYESIISVCIMLGNKREAFEYLEKTKSRAFLDILSTSTIRPHVLRTPKLNSLLKQEQEYIERIRELQIRKYIEPSAGTEITGFNSIMKNLDRVYKNIEKSDPEYVHLRNARTLPLYEIQKLLSKKGDNAILVEYFITKDKMFIFVISKNEIDIKTIELEQVETNLFDFVNRFLVEISMHDDTDYLKDLLRQLSNYLIKPVSEFISKADLIYFVPYGNLNYFPLHALELNGEPLIKNHAIAYSQNASILQFYEYKGNGSLTSCKSFGFGGRDEEKIVIEEAIQVAQIFGTTAFLNVNKAQIIESISKGVDIVHFSANKQGLIQDDPLTSGILISENETLTSKEIFNLNLESELVTLSAGRTGISERKKGDELMGLPRALIYAGTSSVIVSLWSVDANATKELMLEFYQRLKNGRSKANALQEAQKKIMEIEKYSHPYFWAPFILIGNSDLNRNRSI